MRPTHWCWCLLLLAAAVCADEDDERQPAAPVDSNGVFSLSASQQQAVGIRVDQPAPMSGPRQVEAYGEVLDPATLASDAGHLDSTAAAAEAAAADLARLDNLYRNNADASLRALQAARAAASEAEAQARAAAVAFRQQWGPLAALGAPARRELIDALAAGKTRLLRADVPGRPMVGGIAGRALVLVDGTGVDARVLGPLPRADAATQSSGWLLRIEPAPEGLGAGARVRVQLQARAANGLLVPSTALLYGEQGAYVFRASETAGGGAQYTAVPVRPLLRLGEGWLVDGLERNDRVVVQGAGVLWSLAGISTFTAAEEEHD